MGAPETGERGKRGGVRLTDFPRLVTHYLGSLMLAPMRAFRFSVQAFLFIIFKTNTKPPLGFR